MATPAKNSIPEGFHAVTPHVVIRDAAKAIDFYKRAFGAEEICRMPGPEGKIMHAEIRIGDSVLMIGEEFPGMCLGPQTLGGTPVTLHLYVKDADAAFNKAVAAGCKVTMPLADMFWGDRYGKLTDPFGHAWSIATHKQDVTPEECAKLGAEAMAKMGKQCGT
jgi:uncharacterized glyoxalase superfamily protein PhnB